MNQFLLIKNYVDDFIAALLYNRKIIVKHLVVLLPVMVCYGSISFAGKLIGAEVLFKLCQSIIFAGAGLLHFHLLNKALGLYQIRFKGGAVMYTISLSVLICIVLLCFYLFTENSLALVAFASAAAFSLPHICLQGWQYYKNIPPKQHRLWTAPAKEKDINELLIPKAVTFRFLLPVRNSDDEEETFFKTVPEEWKLGKVFFTLLKEKEDRNNQGQIEYRDQSGNLYGWEFHIFLLNGLIKKRLEPEESISDNMITRKSLIQVTRVTVEDADVPGIHTIQYKTIFGAEKPTHTSGKQTMKLYENHS